MLLTRTADDTPGALGRPYQGTASPSAAASAGRTGTDSSHHVRYNACGIAPPAALRKAKVRAAVRPRGYRRASPGVICSSPWRPAARLAAMQPSGPALHPVAGAAKTKSSPLEVGGGGRLDRNGYPGQCGRRGCLFAFHLAPAVRRHSLSQRAQAVDSAAGCTSLSLDSMHFD